METGQIYVQNTSIDLENLALSLARSSLSHSSIQRCSPDTVLLAPSTSRRPARRKTYSQPPMPNLNSLHLSKFSLMTPFRILDASETSSCSSLRKRWPSSVLLFSSVFCRSKAERILLRIATMSLQSLSQVSLIVLLTSSSVHSAIAAKGPL